MSDLRFPRRPRPRLERPRGPWSGLLDLRGPELVQGVTAWLEAAGLEPRVDEEGRLWVGEVAVRVLEGGPVHGFSPSMLREAAPGRLTVLVVSPFPEADQPHLHAVRPHPDLEREARLRRVRITRVWDLVAGGPSFAAELLRPGEGGFLAAR